MIDKIKILSHEVDVLSVPSSEFNSNELHHGMFSTGRNAILINQDLNGSRYWSTLWHEVVEWISADLEIGLEHDQISALSEVLAQVIHDNFELLYVSELSEELKEGYKINCPPFSEDFTI